VKKLVGKLRSLGKRDEGASAVEYGLLVALIAVVIAATIAFLGGALNTKFQESCDAVANGDAPCAAP
jgi:pilus assembly protein Flp/PilA